MSQFGRRFDEALDRHITGNQGEAQFRDLQFDASEDLECPKCCGCMVKRIVDDEIFFKCQLCGYVEG